MLDSSTLVTDVMSICNENTLREPKLNNKCIGIKWQLSAIKAQAEMQTTAQYVPNMTLQIMTEQDDVDSTSPDSLQIMTRKDDADFASLDLHIHGSKPKRDEDSYGKACYKGRILSCQEAHLPDELSTNGFADKSKSSKVAKTESLQKHNTYCDEFYNLFNELTDADTLFVLGQVAKATSHRHRLFRPNMNVFASSKTLLFVIEL